MLPVARLLSAMLYTLMVLTIRMVEILSLQNLHTFFPQGISAPFSLGGTSGITEAQAFKGNFAEVRVWNHALTDAEKRNIYDRRLNGRESG